MFLNLWLLFVVWNTPAWYIVWDLVCCCLLCLARIEICLRLSYCFVLSSTDGVHAGDKFIELLFVW